MRTSDAELVAAVAARNPASTLAKLPKIAEVMARYKEEMQKANRLAQEDERAAVEQMALAVGHLNDALSIGKDAALVLRELVADAREGKSTPWAAPDRRGKPGRPGLTVAERWRIVLVVALVEARRAAPGAPTRREIARDIVRKLRVAKRDLDATRIENWCDELDRYLPDEEWRNAYNQALDVSRQAPEEALAEVARSFAQASKSLANNAY